MNSILDDLAGDVESDARCFAEPFGDTTFCPDCGHVDDLPEDLRNSPCKTCGRNCNTRMILFGDEQVELLQNIFECYRGKTAQLCVLLFCALTEQHLRNLIISRCRRFGVDRQVTNLLLRGHWRFDQRKRLFKQMIAQPPASDVFTVPEVKPVFDGYDSLQTKRDILAHALPGSTWKIPPEDIRLAVQLAAESFPAFALLHHRYCSVDSPSLPA